METLFVLTAVVVADALPVCSAYCKSLFPRPFDCNCRVLQEENLLPHNIQVSFFSWNNSYQAIENSGNDIKEKVTRGEPDKIFGDKIFQIYTKILSECRFQLILSDRKCNNTGFKAKVNSYHGNYKPLSDSELLILAFINSRKTNKDAMLAAIIDKICLKKDNFEGVTFNANSRSVNINEYNKDYIFLKDERTSSTQLPMRTLTDVTSPEDLTNPRTIQSTIVNTNTVTIDHELKKELNNITTQSKEHVVRIAPNVPVKSNSTKNITLTMDSNKTLLNSSLNPLPNLLTTTIDYKIKMDDNNSSGVNGKFIAQNMPHETEYNIDLDRIHDHSFADLPKNNNNMATEITKQYNTSFTRNNLIMETLPEEMHEIAVLARSAINPIQDENTYRPLANSPESSNLKIYDNKKTSLERNKNREHYNERDVPIVRIISREYPNDTVSSIINGSEILPNDDFIR